VTVGSIEPDLIYDVGLHDGQDSAYYLSKGYRVVAIEANPELARQAEEHFRAEISAQQLTVLNVAIGETTGEATFWICDDHTDWSSFDRDIASRQGARHHALRVQRRPFREILSDHGVPHYCKVDIEGSDYLCLDALSRDHRPPFISVEVGFGPMLERLADLGYDRFKVIDQSRFSTGSAWFYRSKAALTAAPCQAGLERLNSALRARRQDGEWKFRLGSSGALPDRTRGRWVSLRRAQRLIELLASQHRRGILGLSSWFDLHATNRATLSSA
jgi:FkbM family methyltransferase